MRTGTLIDDIAAYHFPEHIMKHIKNNIAQRQPPDRRGRPRRVMILYYVMSAYYALDEPPDNKRIIDLLRLEEKDIKRAFMMFGGREVIQVDTFMTPGRYIEGFGNQLHLPSRLIETSKKFAERLMQEEVTLLNEKPREVAAGCLIYFCSIDNYAPQLREYIRDISGISHSALRRLYNKIAELDNVFSEI